MPVVGVNTFLPKEGEEEEQGPVALMRSSDDEKQWQIANLRAFQARNVDRADEALDRLRTVARNGANVFAELMETVRYCSLGQITNALFEIGGQYRRSM